MIRRPATALLLPILLLTGACSSARESVGAVRDCAALASDVARAGLSGVPSQEQAEQAATRLEDRIGDLESGEVRDAATALRDRLRELQQAAASADPAAVTSAVQGARDAARSTAEACGLPVDQFLGG